MEHNKNLTKYVQVNIPKDVGLVKVTLVKESKDISVGIEKAIKNGFLHSHKSGANGHLVTLLAVVFGLAGPVFCFAGKRFSRFIALAGGLFVGVGVGSPFKDMQSWLFFLQFILPFVGLIAG